MQKVELKRVKLTNLLRSQRPAPKLFLREKRLNISSPNVFCNCAWSDKMLTIFIHFILSYLINYKIYKFIIKVKF